MSVINIFLLIIFLWMTSISVNSSFIRDITSDDNKSDDVSEDNRIEQGNTENEAQEADFTRETNVEIQQNYLECVNINSDVHKLTANITTMSNRSCHTIYRFPASQITYQVIFKNQSSANMKIQLELQESEIYPDKTIVTLTGKVMDGYLSGAHFQNVIVYSPLKNQMVCSTESGLRELQSTSASVTFILLPTIAENSSKTYRALHLPEAFDCFGNTTIKYSPGLVQFSQ